MKEFEINPANLFDSPYDGRIGKSIENLFIFNPYDLDDLISDIKLSNPSCYLVSGYRGVGKTSFIRKVESLMTSKSGEENQIAFVYTSFTKYDGQQFLLRKLIRALYLRLAEFPPYKDLDAKAAGVNALKERLHLLNKRTLFEVSSIKEWRSQDLNSTSWNFSASIGQILITIAPIFALLLTLFPVLTLLYSTIPVLRYLLLIGSVLWIIASRSKINKLLESKVSQEQVEQSKSIYDVEVADYFFFDVLNKLKDHGIKIVFVVDELDKVDSNGADRLIDEIKPYMVSGLASFIIVSGQRLYYKFYQHQNFDDAVLSSIFSRTIHIPLVTPASLRSLVYQNLLIDPSFYSGEELKELDALLSYFIFKSRLVPRRFITILRRNVYYRDGKAFISRSKDPGFLDCTELLSSIDSICDSYIIPDGHDLAIRDHMIMSLYIRANTELFLPLAD